MAHIHEITVFPAWQDYSVGGLTFPAKGASSLTLKVLVTTIDALGHFETG